MTLRIFETNNARYFLGLGMHPSYLPESELLTDITDPFDSVNFANIDMLILEDGPDFFSSDQTTQEHLSRSTGQTVLSRAVEENPSIQKCCN